MSEEIKTYDMEMYHKEAIQEITRLAQLQIQPHIDALVEIENMRPKEYFIVVDGLVWLNEWESKQ